MLLFKMLELFVVKEELVAKSWTRDARSKAAERSAEEQGEDQSW